MAIALKEGRRCADIEAVAERPDGTRVPFIPYPTPFKDESGRVIGAINVLVDTGERKEAEALAARLAAIVTSSDDAIISKTLDGIDHVVERRREPHLRLRRRRNDRAAHHPPHPGRVAGRGSADHLPA